MGSPRVGVNFVNIYEVKETFKQALQAIKRQNLTNHADELALKYSYKSTKEFWKYVINSNNSLVTSEQIDGHRGKENITRFWQDEYEQIYDTNMSTDKKLYAVVSGT